METKKYSVIPQEAKDIRICVFIDEQGYEEEFDELDPISQHVVLFDNGTPIGTCRYYPGNTPNTYIIGRVALIPSYRGKHLGEYILHIAEEYIKEDHGEYIRLHAQCRVQSFYEKQGYHTVGESDFDEGVPHIWMEKQL